MEGAAVVVAAAAGGSRRRGESCSSSGSACGVPIPLLPCYESSRTFLLLLLPAMLPASTPPTVFVVCLLRRCYYCRRHARESGAFWPPLQRSGPPGVWTHGAGTWLPRQGSAAGRFAAKFSGNA